MLANKAETGRLDINLEESSTAQLYLMNGKPVDCCLGYLQGSEALDALLSSDNGTFRFSSGIVPPNLMFRNGESGNLAVISQNITSTAEAFEYRCPEADPVAEAADSPDAVAQPPATFKGGTLVAVLASVALGVGLTIGSVIARVQHSAKAEATVLKSESRITGAPSTPPPTSPKEQQRSNPPATSARAVRPSNLTTFDSPEPPKVKKQTAKVVSIPVVVRIEEGRVVEAYAANPQPGQEAYESTAVRLARQRRFTSQSGTETVFLTISEK